METAPKRLGLHRVLRHEKLFAWPLFVASLVWFGCLTAAWVDQHPSALVRSWCAALLAATWGWFILDFVYRLVLAGSDRSEFIRTRVFDLVTITVPFLRPFMILSFIWRLPVFRRRSARLLRARYALMTALFSFLLVYVGSYLVWAAEKHHPGAQIQNFGEALWWGFTTITTVGYGDFVPVTVMGRVFAVFLMVGGVFVVGVITATVVSALSDRLKQLMLHVESDATERSVRAERTERTERTD